MGILTTDTATAFVCGVAVFVAMFATIGLLGGAAFVADSCRRAVLAALPHRKKRVMLLLGGRYVEY